MYIDIHTHMYIVIVCDHEITHTSYKHKLYGPFFVDGVQLPQG